MTAPNGVIGIVDYAHTPDAVQNVLETIHQLRPNKEKIITVIGCGGDRDTAKRPVMAQVACAWSDKVILTSDNPSTAYPAAIIRDMDTGENTVHSRKNHSLYARPADITGAWNLTGTGDII